MPIVSKRTKSTFRIELSKAELIESLNTAADCNGDSPLIPKSALVQIKLPSGGDISGTILDLADYPCIITWETTEP